MPKLLLLVLLAAAPAMAGPATGSELTSGRSVSRVAHGAWIRKAMGDILEGRVTRSTRHVRSLGIR